jgi:hypothetical protein
MSLLSRVIASLGGMAAGFIIGIAAVEQPTGWNLVVVIVCAIAAWTAGMLSVQEGR